MGDAFNFYGMWVDLRLRYITLSWMFGVLQVDAKLVSFTQASKSKIQLPSGVKTTNT